MLLWDTTKKIKTLEDTMIVGLIIGIICVISIKNAVRKQKEKDEAEALRNMYTHPIHRSIHHNIHDR